MVASTDAGVGALQPVEPHDFEPFILRIRIDGARCCASLADNFNDVALHQTVGRHKFARHPRQTTSRIFELGIGNLQFLSLGFRGQWLRLALVEQPK